MHSVMSKRRGHSAAREPASGFARQAFLFAAFLCLSIFSAHGIDHPAGDKDHAVSAGVDVLVAVARPPRLTTDSDSSVGSLRGSGFVSWSKSPTPISFSILAPSSASWGAVGRSGGRFLIPLRC